MTSTDVQDPKTPIKAANEKPPHVEPSLEEFLRDLGGLKVYYCANPGNGGDSLIALATFRLFKKLKIDYRIVAWDEDVELYDEIVIYAGGGNLVGLYPQASTFFSRHHTRARRLILLPSTIRKNDDLLASLGANVDLICRERTSYKHVQRAVSGPGVHLMDDVALSLNAHQVIEARMPPMWRVISECAVNELTRRVRPSDIQLRTVARCLKARVRTKGSWRGPDGNVLNAFRTDREQPNRPLPEDNVDLSRIFALGTHSEAASEYASNQFLSFIDMYEVVRTDRLHVCIGAALLGKQVEFFPNSYFKNEAVFDFSLRDRFPNVAWHGG